MIENWLKANKGSSFLKMMSMCDVAYCISLLSNSNSSDCWMQDVEVKEKSEEEQLKHRYWKDIENPQERKEYKMVEPKYSGGKGMKRVFCSVMWNAEGMKFYNDAEKVWSDDRANPVIWDQLEELWDVYVTENNS